MGRRIHTEVDSLKVSDPQARINAGINATTEMPALIRCAAILFIALTFSSFRLSAQTLDHIFDSGRVTMALQRVGAKDQALRERLVYIDQHWWGDMEANYDSLWAVQKSSDRLNSQTVNQLKTRYGWDKLMTLDSGAKSVIVLVIQHSDSLNQTKYLPLVYRAVKNGQLPARSYALMKDRITVLQTKRQYYGTQFYWDDKRKANLPFPITGGHAAGDKRRAAPDSSRYSWKFSLPIERLNVNRI